MYVAENDEITSPKPRDLDVTQWNRIPTNNSLSRSLSGPQIDPLSDLSDSAKKASSYKRLCEGSIYSPAPSPQESEWESTPHPFQQRLYFRSKNEEFFPENDQEPMVIIMVGLPGRGKSYIARRICRYLNWKGVPTNIFNAGQYRRNNFGSEHESAWFDPNNKETAEIREKCAEMACTDLIRWLKRGGQVGIFDATNTTQARRSNLVKRFLKDLEIGIHRLLFLEIVCTDMSIIESTIRQVKMAGKDYKSRNMDGDEAYQDFHDRIQQYEKAYTPLNPNDPEDVKLSFIKLLNAGAQVFINQVQGTLHSSILHFTMNLRPYAPTLYITRHGSTDDTVCGRLGGDAPLNDMGLEQARRLRDFFDKLGYKEMHIWTSPDLRCKETADAFLGGSNLCNTEYKIQTWRLLSDLNYGECDGMTYEEIQEKRPVLWELLCKDEYFQSYPRGESPHTLINRLDPLLTSLERATQPLLLIIPPIVARVIISYVRDLVPEECVRVTIPRDVVFEFNMNTEIVEIQGHILS